METMGKVKLSFRTFLCFFLFSGFRVSPLLDSFFPFGLMIPIPR